jgi:hypothetical protein
MTRNVCSECEEFLTFLNKLAAGLGSFIKLYAMKKMGSKGCSSLCDFLKVIESMYGEEGVSYIVKIIEARKPDFYKLLAQCR